MDYFGTHDYLKEKEVSLQVGEDLVLGKEKGVNEDFALLLEIEKRIVPFVSGEIVSIKP